MDKINPEAIKTPGIFIPLDLDQENLPPGMIESAAEEVARNLGDLGVEACQVVVPETVGEVELFIPENSTYKWGKVGLSEARAELNELSNNNDGRRLTLILSSISREVADRREVTPVKYLNLEDYEKPFMDFAPDLYDIEIDLDILAGYLVADAFAEKYAGRGIGLKRRSALNQFLNHRLQIDD